jgi:hypothetical protein
MATSVVQFNPSQLPAFARERTGSSALTQALAGKQGGFGNRISIRGGVFRLIAGGKEIASIEERYLDVVIIRAADSIGRTYYAGEFSEEQVTAPLCYSVDGNTPAKDSAEPQSDSCATCPQNIKGSGKNDSRACRFSQRLAVLLANNLEGEVLQLQVPAKSLFGKEENGQYPLQAYARWLAAQKVDPDIVVTRMKFDTDESAPKLYFKAMRYVSEEEFDIIKEAAESDEAKRAVEMTVAQMDRVPAPLNIAGTPPVKKAAPAPAPQAADDEDEPPAPPPAKRGRPRKNAAAEQQQEAEADAEPVVRKAPEAPVMPARKTLASTVADWDTDD